MDNMVRTVIWAATIVALVAIVAFTAVAITLIVTNDSEGSGSISGKVLRSDGSSGAGIHVYACPIPRDLCGYALTEADGSYSIEVRNGNYRVQFGRTPVGENPDGFYSAFSTYGFVKTTGEASQVVVRGKSVPGIDVRLPY